MKVVPKESAALGLPDEFNIPANACHREICKFATPYDLAYKTLMAKIKQALEREASFSTMIQFVPELHPVGDSNAATTPQRQRSLNRRPHKIFPPYIPPDRHFIGRDDIVDAAEAHFSEYRHTPERAPTVLCPNRDAWNGEDKLGQDDHSQYRR
ncbi:hypothetical protein B0T14DRAFT_565586 [Immersiella caudata]|uniref:Uncharacterized protein n=1 Tax=Immersiella caudata TaxID=314043 RepID=A0AA40C434_9PEZI|nr:hypothetical protein B0T14DRAFT_565586 [Immersiella caudata]